MYLRLIVGLAVILSLTGFAPAPMPNLERTRKLEAEKARLQGTWTVEEFAQSGSVGVAVTPQRLQVTGDQWVITQNMAQGIYGQFDGAIGRAGLLVRSKEMPGYQTQTTLRFELPATGKAGQIDLISEAGRRTVYSGIYRLDGDVLTVCYRTSETRPESFEDRTGSTILLKLRRAR